jgi:CHAT domain-containing protein/tetratricopeptide (TPR) repeat protein
LGDAYDELVEGDTAENQERAIAHYTEALQGYHRDVAPVPWSLTHNRLGNVYRFRRRGDPAENIEKAIELYKSALEVRTRDAHPEAWAATTWNLAGAYEKRKHGELAENIEKAIELYEAAREVHTRKDFPVDWGMIQDALGSAYSRRRRGKEADNIERAIELYESALQIRTRAAFPREWSQTQWNLAAAYENRIRGTEAANLEKAIELYGSALEIKTRAKVPVDWAAIHSNLAHVYFRRLEGEPSDNLEKAMELCRLALEVRTREDLPKEWAATTHNLADVYSDRLQGVKAENLERAIELYELALEIRTRESLPAGWATTLNNLALAYNDRIRGDRADNLEKAIELLNAALEVRTREDFPKDWAASQNNLALTYHNRIRGEKTDNLEKAIELYEAALEVYTREDYASDWAMTQLNLATAHSDRIRGERAVNLETSIGHYEAALEVYTREGYPADWALTQTNLALAYGYRVEGDKADNLEKAITLLGETLEIRTRKNYRMEWATTQHCLGSMYTDRIRGEKAENHQSAIKHYEAALEVCTRDEFPIDWAIEHYSLAGVNEKAGDLKKAVEHCVAALEIYTQDAFPADYRMTQSRLGRLCFDQREYVRAHDAYDAAIEASADQLHRSYTEDGRRTEVGETSGLYAMDANCLVRLGRPSEALLRLELGRTRLLGEALALADAEIAALPVTDQAAIHTARQSIRELEAQMRPTPQALNPRGNREVVESLRRARGALRDIVGKIRGQRPDFMRAGLGLKELLGLIPEGGALVSFAITSRGSTVFVVPHGATDVTAEHVVEIDSGSYEALRSVLRGGPDKSQSGWIGAYANYRQFGAGSPWFEDSWFQVIETAGQEIWNHLFGAIHSRLKTLGMDQGAPVVLLPQGWLRLLPLHAAWRTVEGSKRFFLDDWTVAYAPSCFVLAAGRKRLTESRRQGRALLAISDPTRNLPYTTEEVKALAGLFQSPTILEGPDADVNAVLQAAPGSQYLHLACHGFYDWRDPMQSGLLLAAGQRLTLSDIIARLDLSASRLVTVSACETGITDTEQAPDEFVGLQAGFLQAGAPVVLSSLWAVNDRSTELLMSRFYQNLFGSSGKNSLAPAFALREAQQWLRNATAKTLDSNHDALASPEGPAADRPFSHPHHWAAFIVSGPHVG